MSKEVEEAAGRIERYVAMRDAKPLNNLDDLIHGIHTGTEWAAELRLSDLRASLSLARREREMREALEFYADPEVYHGCAFMFDRPTGGFDEDFSDDHGHGGYDREMPGKRARAALSKDQP